MAFVRLRRGACALGPALVVSGCAPCGPDTCPAGKSAMLHLREVTDVLEAGYDGGEDSPLNLEEAMGSDLPIRLGAGGVLRRHPEGLGRGRSSYILEMSGNVVFVDYGLAQDARRTPLLHFLNNSPWGFDNCYWMAGRTQGPEWRCLRR